MRYPRWSGKHPDYIVLRLEPEVVDLSDMDGTWLDRSKMPYLEAAASLHNLVLEPCDELEVGLDGTVAQVWSLGPEK